MLFAPMSTMNGAFRTPDPGCPGLLAAQSAVQSALHVRSNSRDSSNLSLSANLLPAKSLPIRELDFSTPGIFPRRHFQRIPGMK